jgi:hypothetical protein
MYIVTMIQVKALLSAEPITQAAQLDGKRTLMTNKWIWSFLTCCLGPQLKVVCVQAPHLQVLQR